MKDQSVRDPFATDGASLNTLHIAAVTAGDALEFYDFVVCSFFAIQIGKAFFPPTNPYGSLMLSLAVEPQQVVLGEAEAADGCLIHDPAVRSMPVVAVQPVGQLVGSLVG